MQKIVLIDGHGLLFRTINAASYEIKKDKSFKFGAGVETSNTNGLELYSLWKRIFSSSFFNLISTLKPNKVVFAIDDKVSWRKDVYSNYKSTRKIKRAQSDINFEEFYSIANEFVEDFKNVFSMVEFIKCDKCEGDDLIAVFTRIYKGNKIVIVSVDGDMNQLLDENVEQWDPVKKKFVRNINSKLFLETKILMGDRGDDIPPIFPGIGPKTVLKYINEPLDILLSNDVVKKNYLRNKTIITLTELPHEIEQRVISEHSKYQPTNQGQSLMSFLIKHKLMAVSSDFNSCLNYLRKNRCL